MTTSEDVTLLPCADVERALQSYTDRRLTEAEVVLVERHLVVCPRCSACYRLETAFRAHVRTMCGGEPCPESLKLRLRKLCDTCDCE
jgi:anti-sigma factor (TIGR02949 family)